jgi:hypothetical protein
MTLKSFMVKDAIVSAHDGQAGDAEFSVSDGGSSAVAWGAILAGAAAAAALSLVLLILGTGLGLASVSPWAQASVSAATFGVSTILWITFTQLTASGMGGYLAGRLRTRWTAVQHDEVYFRDTAHGFLAWAIASLATAALLSSVIASIVGTGTQMNASMVEAATAATVRPTNAALHDSSRSPAGTTGMAYFVDTLFRQSPADVVQTADNSFTSPNEEVLAIFANSAGNAQLPDEDLRYLAQLVAARTGLTETAAKQRVLATYQRMQDQARTLATSAKEAADTARKASSHAALWLFISLLAGAFVASFAATLGGRQRDL